MSDLESFKMMIAMLCFAGALAALVWGLCVFLEAAEHRKRIDNLLGKDEDV